MADINGSSGADQLNGTAGGDLIGGDTGPDTILARKGNDTVAAGGGHDTVKGSAGDDVLYGYSRADVSANSGLIRVTLAGSGLEAPVFAMSAPGDPDRLFVVEKNTGQIEILDLATGTLAADAFLDIEPTDMTTNGERGLLGLAFAPDYATSGKFYVDVTNADGDIEIREYTADPETDELVPDSKRVLLTIEHSSAANHNGGWVGFGPDGCLYITVGDGGGGGDQDNSAQNLNSLTGKVLRIDPSTDGFPGDPDRNYAVPADNPFVGDPGVKEEVWAYGLRNPFRMSFDPLTGDGYIGDVGQFLWEEIDLMPAGVGGLNFGWHVMEGDHVFDDDTPGNPEPGDPILTGPLVEYRHLEPPGPFGGNVVTGGYVNRGPEPGGQGLYFFADFGSDNLWTLREVDGEAVDFINHNHQLQGGSFQSIASFAVDGRGNLYGINIGGTMLLLRPSEAAGDGADKLAGGDGADSLYGGSGFDKLIGGEGDDFISGGLGNDRITAGAGRDVMRGDAGADWYIFRNLIDSLPEAPDRIAALDDEDVIDLRGIDANATQAGDQAFVVVSDFTAQPGELVLTFQSTQNRTLMSGDVDGDGAADMNIVLNGGDHTDFTGILL